MPPLGAFLRSISILLLMLCVVPLFAETVDDPTPNTLSPAQSLSEEDVATEAQRLREEFQKNRSQKREAESPVSLESKDLDLSHWGPVHPLSGINSLWSSIRTDGEADSFAMRGVDAEQGRGIAFTLDGVPLNQADHVRSQGYTDLHFIIPELVERVDVLRGSSQPSRGDFAAVGSVDVISRRSLPENLALLGTGMASTLRGVAIASVGGDFRPLIGAEFYSSAGPYQNPQGLKRYNLFTRVTHTFDSATELSFTFLGHSSDWKSSGALPARTQGAGGLGSLDSLDPSQGGTSRRYSGVARLSANTGRDQTLSVTAYVTRSEFTIFSNETFFNTDPLRGDEREGLDRRTTIGANGSYRIDQRKSEIGFDTFLGVGLQGDFINRNVYADAARTRISGLADDKIQTKNLSASAEQDIYWTKWLKSVASVRAEYLSFNLEGGAPTTTHATALNGTQGAFVLAPKTAIVVSASKTLDVYVRTGLSYQSNDAKGVLLTGTQDHFLTRISGYEGGLHGRTDALDWEITGFSLGIDRQVNFDPLYESATEVGASSRLGVDARIRYAVLDWLSIEAAMTLTRAKMDNAASGNDAVPLAPTRTASAALIAKHPKGYFGRFGMTQIADRPATMDRTLTATGFMRFDAMLGYRTKSFEISLAALNLFNTNWGELQSVGISKLSNETVAVQDVNFISGTPFNLQASATIFF